MSQVNGDGKKVAYLGMPTYGSMTDGAARGFFVATHPGSELVVNRKTQCSSLLALNMNHLWCWALNAEFRGERVDYFAMQHSDIQPLNGWLDDLIEELEANQLDVLGVVAPIKDQEGKTSIAMAHPSGDPFQITGRLTMREVYRLPETFTSEHVGHSLLLNTGLWVVKWGDWCKQIHFTVNDEIAFAEDKHCYLPQVESEDWFISRAFHALGLKVGCTRKIELGHAGHAVFGNTQPWGSLEFDKYHLEKSILDDKPLDWFPHNVAGWLTESEGQELARLAEGKVVLEIGAYAGRSTICLAQKAVCVGVIDTFDGRGTSMPCNTLPLFSKNIRQYGLADKVQTLQGESLEVMATLAPAYDIIFIDGSHDRESVAADAEAASRLLKPDGLLVFHDYQANDPGVTEAIDEFIAGGATLVSRRGSLAVVRPPAGVLLEA